MKATLRLCAVLLTSCASAVLAADDLPAVLARPLSPASVALLLNHPVDSAILEHWALALDDGRAEVRATAARVVHVAAARTLGRQLSATFARETDVEAAREQVRALVTIVDPPNDAALLETARRLGEPVVTALAEALARVRGVATFASLPALRAAGLHPGSLRRMVELATAGGKNEMAGVAESALSAGDAELWNAALDVARRARQSLPIPVLVRALRSPIPDVRAAALWHVAISGDPHTPPAAELRAAIESGAASTDPPFARELIARQIGGDHRTGANWTTRLQDRALSLPDSMDELRAIAPWLTKDERRVVSMRVVDKPDTFEHAAAYAPGHGPTSADRPTLSTLLPPPPGLLNDVVAATGCQLALGQIGAAEITYDAAGRPRHVTLAQRNLSEACALAARTLFVSSLVPESQTIPTPTPQLVLVGLGPDSVACLAEPPPPLRTPAPRTEPEGVGRRIKEPTKLHTVPPIYPTKAKDERRQGTVVLEATISTSGCIRGVFVAHSVAPDLDVEAARAVLGWRYTPTLLDGVPVPVQMNVTINYTLR